MEKHWNEGLDQEVQPNNTDEKLDGDPVERVRNANQVFIRNLPYTASETDLLHIFESYGDIIEVNLAKDKTGR